MTLRTLKVPVGLQLVSGVRYGDSARSIILSAMSSYRGFLNRTGAERAPNGLVD